MPPREWTRSNTEQPTWSARSEDKTCSVYEVRPLTCRSFGSTNADVCAQKVPDEGNTFRVIPNSLKRLLATSGLFFVPFLQGCLDWWKGEGLEGEAVPGVQEAMAEVQKMLNRQEIQFIRLNGGQP